MTDVVVTMDAGGPVLVQIDHARPESVPAIGDTVVILDVYYRVGDRVWSYTEDHAALRIVLVEKFEVRSY